MNPDPPSGRRHTGSLWNETSNYQVNPNQNGPGPENFNIAYRPKLVFGEQDAFGAAIENIQVTINGQSISNSRLTDYKTTLDRCWFEEPVFQRRFPAGGAPMAYDSQCVSGEAF